MIENENTIKMSSKTFPYILFASSMVLCQTFKLSNEWDGIQNLVNAINKHNKAYFKEREGNGDWLEEESDSLSAPFDDLPENDVGSETDAEDIEKRQLDSSELNKLNNMKLELENDIKRNILRKRKPNNLVKKELDEFEMKRRETLVTLPNLDDFNENNHDYEYMDNKKQNQREILDILNNQLQVVEDFVDYLKDENTISRQGKTEFDEILDSIQNKRPVVKTTTETTTSEKPIVTSIDERDIKDALKNDPLVKRILKIAKLKRTEYMKKFDYIES